MNTKKRGLIIEIGIAVVCALGFAFTVWSNSAHAAGTKGSIVAKSAKPAIKLSVLASKLSSEKIQRASICIEDVEAADVVNIMVELVNENAIQGWSVRQSKNAVCVSVR